MKNFIASKLELLYKMCMQRKINLLIKEGDIHCHTTISIISYFIIQACISLVGDS